MTRYMILIRTDGTGRLIRCDELITTCKQLMDRLDKEDSDCVYMAQDARCAAERLQRVLQTITEQEE